MRYVTELYLRDRILSTKSRSGGFVIFVITSHEFLFIF